jgi:hypothetical protein
MLEPMLTIKRRWEGSPTRNYAHLNVKDITALTPYGKPKDISKAKD